MDKAGGANLNHFNSFKRFTFLMLILCTPPKLVWNSIHRFNFIFLQTETQNNNFFLQPLPPGHLCIQFRRKIPIGRKEFIINYHSFFFVLEVGNDDNGRFHPVLRNCRLDLNGTHLLIIYENTTHSVSNCISWLHNNTSGWALL